MKRPLTVFIVGGYGTFGGRLARLLGDVERLTLLIGGRSLTRAQEFCSQETTGVRDAVGAVRGPRTGEHAPPGAQLRAVHFDRDADLHAQLRALQPDVVVDASGPFQSYGERPYRLVEACIECGVHYLDLADSAEFVCEIGRFDESARARGVFVLSGVSSFPVLTAAVVRVLAVGMARVEGISGGIAPSPFANVGLNVIRAIAGYAGKRVRLRERVGYAFTETMRYTVAAPGCLPLHSIEFSLVDVPDLYLLADEWPECRSVWMGAGPVPAVWHRVLRGLAWLVRLRVLPSLSWMSSMMYRAINAFSWGEHRGGMFVQVVGADSAGARVVRSWHLIAERESGPLIPSMAAEAIIRKCVDGHSPAAGARAAVRELEVSDYEPLLARRAIVFGVRDDTVAVANEVPLYQRIVGTAWHALPEAIRAMHAVRAPDASVGCAESNVAGEGTTVEAVTSASMSAAAEVPASISTVTAAETVPFVSTAAAETAASVSMVAAGRANVARGKGWLASWVASVVGFPLAGTDVPVEVRFEVTRTAPGGSRERWTRRFAGGAFSSEQFAGTGRFDRLVCERFGPLTLALALVVDDSRLRLFVRGWSLFGIPLPRALAPYCDAFEAERDGRFHFDVAIGHRWTGLIVHYRGWLVVESATPCLGGETGRRKGLEALSTPRGNGGVNGVKVGGTAARQGGCNTELSLARSAQPAVR